MFFGFSLFQLSDAPSPPKRLPRPLQDCPRAPKRARRRPNSAPRLPPDPPKTAQESPKKAPRGAQESEREPNNRALRPKMPPGGPKRPQRQLKRPPRGPQDVQKRPQQARHRAKRPTRGSKGPPNCPHRGPKRRPNRHEQGLKMLQACFEETPDVSKHTEGRSINRTPPHSLPLVWVYISLSNQRLWSVRVLANSSIHVRTICGCLHIRAAVTLSKAGVGWNLSAREARAWF